MIDPHEARKSDIEDRMISRATPMKILYTSFNQKLGINPMVARTLHPIPGFEPGGVHDCEAVFLSVVAPESDFVPDKLLLDAVSRRKLPVIIFDHTETFPDHFLFGVSKIPQVGPYQDLSSMIGRELIPKAYFKRELLSEHTPEAANAGGFTFPVYPIDWTLGNIPGLAAPVDTEEQYHNRPIDIFYSWGYSNEGRPRLMGELLRQAGRFNAHFCLTEEDLDRALAEGRKRIFALLFTPHYRRIHISKIIAWQQQSKISISMFGAGKKCFRHAEASYNSVMAQQGVHLLQWSYPWVHDENCLSLVSELPEYKDNANYVSEEKQSVGELYNALRVNQGRLYPIYRAGLRNNEKYHTANYAVNYLLPKIKEALR